VERRAGTKGNADQQSTCRAQNRISVAQALDPRRGRPGRDTANFGKFGDMSLVAIGVAGETGDFTPSLDQRAITRPDARLPDRARANSIADQCRDSSVTMTSVGSGS